MGARTRFRLALSTAVFSSLKKIVTRTIRPTILVLADFGHFRFVIAPLTDLVVERAIIPRDGNTQVFRWCACYKPNRGNEICK